MAERLREERERERERWRGSRTEGRQTEEREMDRGEGYRKGGRERMGEAEREQKGRGEIVGRTARRR